MNNPEGRREDGECFLGQLRHQSTVNQRWHKSLDSRSALNQMLHFLMQAIVCDVF
jgi:hypothetical protein